MCSKNVIPEIFDEPKTQWTTKKYRLLIKHGCKCYYCGCELKVSTVQLEHFIPRIRGGSGGVKSGNIVPSCFRCNMKKGVKDIEGFRKKMFKKSKENLFHFEKLRLNG